MRHRQSSPSALSLHPVTIYRDAAGRFTTQAQAIQTEEYEYLRRGGRFVKAVERVTGTQVVKLTAPGALERAGGMIRQALIRTNVTTKLREVQRIEVSIKGTDGRNKLQRIRLSRLFDGSRVLPETLYGMCVEALHKRGFRTQYALDVVNWKRTHTKKAYVKKLKPLDGVQIQVRVFR